MKWNEARSCRSISVLVDYPRKEDMSSQPFRYKSLFPETRTPKFLSAVFLERGRYFKYRTSSHVCEEILLRSLENFCVSSHIFACFIMGILEKIAEIESEVCIFRFTYKTSVNWVLDARYFDRLQMARTQKNKATAHHLGLLKARLAKLRRELITPKGGGGATGEG